MSDTPRDLTSRGRAATVLRDAHFWIPIVVLLGGLLVLQWLS